MAAAVDVGVSCIDPASPWQNGVCKSFNGRFRDEFLACEQFDTLLEVQVLTKDWRIEYNTYRPHGSLDWLSPDAFRQQWITNRQPVLSWPVDHKAGPVTRYVCCAEG
ncbi:transposase [Planosporangium thailandense]|uniref:Transposase n=1 Tax=Planosporangium thailandense TaxID=765197 RepID=A0ABX0Y026_9ACTN|nr:transposase [Planosporangium thailandense]